MREPSRNVFAVSRSIWVDGDFAPEPFTEREAFMWLVSSAAWKEGKSRGNSGSPLILKRTEFSIAVRFMAEKWRWTKDKTHRFIKRLEKRDMIRDASRDGAQIYSIKNYNHFQVVGLPKRDSDRDDPRDASATAPRQHRDKVETGKQVNRKEEDSPSLPLGVPTDFDEFYGVYPRRIDRKDAERAYAKAVAKTSAATILLAAQHFAAQCQFKDQKFIPHPATWLNKCRWEVLVPDLVQNSPTTAFRERAQRVFGVEADRHIRNFELTFGGDLERAAGRLTEFEGARNPASAASEWFFRHGADGCTVGHY